MMIMMILLRRMPLPVELGIADDSFSFDTTSVVDLHRIATQIENISVGGSDNFILLLNKLPKVNTAFGRAQIRNKVANFCASESMKLLTINLQLAHNKGAKTVSHNKGNRRTRCMLLNISSLLEIIITNCDLI